jgi:hypothetical protein
MKNNILKLYLIFFPIVLLASPQLPDYIIYNNDTISTYNLILEKYLQKQNPNEDKLFGLSFRGNENNPVSFNCWRGYQAIYEIKNDSIFLNSIIDCFDIIDKRKINIVESKKRMHQIFGNNVQNGRVFINWFSGDLSFPIKLKTNPILRWDGVFYKKFEFETAINIIEGIVLKITNVENYVDDPKRIDRRDKNKVSDILFKQLKKTKWKNKNDYDCGEKYLVTIDENGSVSRVKMLYTDEEIEKYYEKEEYNFCITKMFNAMKNLKFDILKDKGKPISEEIYIETWIEDNGNIQNRTN